MTSREIERPDTLAPGPCDFGAAKLDWDRVLQGHRYFALLQIHALTCVGGRTPARQ